MTDILVLSTLHQLHGELPYYTYEHLSQIIENFSPDILAVELTPADLAARKPQQIKREYQHSVYPLLETNQWSVIPLEPGEPTYSELVQKGKKAMETLAKEHPEAMEGFGLYVNALYQVLLGWWKSPLDINSAETDRHFEVKHTYQNALFGKDEEEGWELWNQHFLEQILAAATSCAECRILVLVGAEHGYWLRGALRKQEGIHMLEPASVLRDMGI